VLDSLRRPLIAASLIAVLGAAGCGSDDDSGGGDSVGENDPLVFAQLTGPPEQGDPLMLQGMKMAAAELNEDGGVDGHEIEIKSIPTEASPESVAAAYRQAAQDQEVLGVFNGSGGGLAIRNLAQSTKLPAISASGNDAVDRPIARYVFANAETGPYATAPVRYAVERFGAETVGILHYEPDFDQQMVPSVEAACEEMGCEVVATEESTSTASRSELVPRLTNLRSADPDVYLISELNANALPAARDLGLFDKPVVGVNYLANTPVAEATGEAGEDVYFGTQKCRITDLADLNPDDPMVEFCQAYRDRWEQMYPGEPLQGFSVYGYDAVLAFATAARKVLEEGEDLNRETLTDALENITPEDELFTSAGTVTSTPENHRIVGPFEEGFAMMEMTVGPDGPEYTIAKGADPAGAKP
jgi:branched-chain amino acid transport system substrate-binding protein